MHTILFRNNNDNQEESAAASGFFNLVTQRTAVKSGDTVIPRYSALPFYQELEVDIKNCGAKLINSCDQFNWIANFEYYKLLKNYTFKTYFDFQDLPDIPLVVKGKTNSLKVRWNTHCFAKNKKEAINIACELQLDGLVGLQDIIFREFIPLKTFEILLNGLPVTNEFRFFFYKNQLLAYGYYWVNAQDINKKCDKKGVDFAQQIANIVSLYNNFFVVDIAEKEDGEWIMVELNSGEMSGVATIDCNILYGNLKKHVG
jgi:hypothetical protein